MVDKPGKSEKNRPVPNSPETASLLSVSTTTGRKSFSTAGSTCFAPGLEGHVAFSNIIDAIDLSDMAIGFKVERSSLAATALAVARSMLDAACSQTRKNAQQDSTLGVPQSIYEGGLAPVVLKLNRCVYWLNWLQEPPFAADERISRKGPLYWALILGGTIIFDLDDCSSSELLALNVLISGSGNFHRVTAGVGDARPNIICLHSGSLSGDASGALETRLLRLQPPPLVTGREVKAQPVIEAHQADLGFEPLLNFFLPRCMPNSIGGLTTSPSEFSKFSEETSLNKVQKAVAFVNFDTEDCEASWLMFLMNTSSLHRLMLSNPGQATRFFFQPQPSGQCQQTRDASNTPDLDPRLVTNDTAQTLLSSISVDTDQQQSPPYSFGFSISKSVKLAVHPDLSERHRRMLEHYCNKNNVTWCPLTPIGSQSSSEDGVWLISNNIWEDPKAQGALIVSVPPNSSGEELLFATELGSRKDELFRLNWSALVSSLGDGLSVVITGLHYNFRLLEHQPGLCENPPYVTIGNARFELPGGRLRLHMPRLNQIPPYNIYRSHGYFQSSYKEHCFSPVSKEAVCLDEADITSKTFADFIDLRVKNLKTLLAEAPNQPIYLRGPTGVGKTSIISQLAGQLVEQQAGFVLVSLCHQTSYLEILDKISEIVCKGGLICFDEGDLAHPHLLEMFTPLFLNQALPSTLFIGSRKIVREATQPQVYVVVTGNGSRYHGRQGESFLQKHCRQIELSDFPEGVVTDYLIKLGLYTDESRLLSQQYIQMRNAKAGDVNLRDLRDTVAMFRCKQLRLTLTQAIEHVFYRVLKGNEKSPSLFYQEDLMAEVVSLLQKKRLSTIEPYLALALQVYSRWLIWEQEFGSKVLAKNGLILEGGVGVGKDVAVEAMIPSANLKRLNGAEPQNLFSQLDEICEGGPKELTVVLLSEVNGIEPRNLEKINNYAALYPWLKFIFTTNPPMAGDLARVKLTPAMKGRLHQGYSTPFTYHDHCLMLKQQYPQIDSQRRLVLAGFFHWLCDSHSADLSTRQLHAAARLLLPGAALANSGEWLPRVATWVFKLGSSRLADVYNKPPSLEAQLLHLSRVVAKQRLRGASPSSQWPSIVTLPTLSNRRQLPTPNPVLRDVATFNTASELGGIPVSALGRKPSCPVLRVAGAEFFIQRTYKVYLEGRRVKVGAPVAREPIKGQGSEIDVTYSNITWEVDNGKNRWQVLVPESEGSLVSIQVLNAENKNYKLQCNGTEWVIECTAIIIPVELSLRFCFEDHNPESIPDPQPEIAIKPVQDNAFFVETAKFSRLRRGSLLEELETYLRGKLHLADLPEEQAKQYQRHLEERGDWSALHRAGGGVCFEGAMCFIYAAHRCGVPLEDIRLVGEWVAQQQDATGACKIVGHAKVAVRVGGAMQLFDPTPRESQRPRIVEQYWEPDTLTGLMFGDSDGGDPGNLPMRQLWGVDAEGELIPVKVRDPLPNHPGAGYTGQKLTIAFTDIRTTRSVQGGGVLVALDLPLNTQFCPRLLGAYEPYANTLVWDEYGNAYLEVPKKLEQQPLVYEIFISPSLQPSDISVPKDFGSWLTQDDFDQIQANTELARLVSNSFGDLAGVAKSLQSMQMGVISRNSFNASPVIKAYLSDSDKLEDRQREILMPLLLQQLAAKKGERVWLLQGPRTSGHGQLYGCKAMYPLALNSSRKSFLSLQPAHLKAVDPDRCTEILQPLLDKVLPLPERSPLEDCVELGKLRTGGGIDLAPFTFYRTSYGGSQAQNYPGSFSTTAWLADQQKPFLGPAVHSQPFKKIVYVDLHRLTESEKLKKCNGLVGMGFVIKALGLNSDGRCDLIDFTECLTVAEVDYRKSHYTAFAKPPALAAYECWLHDHI